MNDTCACCGEPGPILANGWISACYFRWYRAGKPDTGPPPRHRIRRADRFAEYAFLREGGEAVPDAARRVGLQHKGTIRQYEAQRKALAQPSQAVA